MYLKTLTIYGFGHFHDRTFTLDAGLNYLVGPNEAGKSTLTQFIVAILFGFPTKKHPELRYEPLDGSRFGGALTFVQAKTQYTVSRTAGPHGGTVTLHDDTTDLTLPATQLPKLLAPMDQLLFTQVYAINEPRLGQVFSASKQALIDRLRHVGAIGSDYWLQRAQQMDKEADTLYKPQGRNPQLNQQLRTYQELTDKLDKANAAYETYWQLRQEQQQRQQQQADLQTQLQQQRRVTTTLTQRVSQWSTYVAWQRLAQNQQAAVSGFSATDATQLEQLRGQLTAAKQALTADQQRIATAQQAAELPEFFQEYLPVAAQVDPLLTELPDVQLASQQQTALKTTRAELQRRATEIEAQFAQDGQMPRAFSLATTQQIDQLQQRLISANQQRRQLQQTLNQLNERYQQLQPAKAHATNPLADKQVVWLTIGLAVLIGAMFLPGAMFKLVGALLGVAVGYYGVFLVDSSTPASRQLQALTDDIRDSQAQLREKGRLIDDLTNQLDVIGTAHGLGHVPVEQWSATQAAIGEWERLTQQLETTDTQLATVAQKVTNFRQQLATVLPKLATSDDATLWQQLATIVRLKTSLKSQESELATIATRLTHDQAAVTSAQQQVTTFLRTRNLQQVDDFYDRYQVQRERASQAKQQAALAAQLGPENLAALQQVSDLAALQVQLQQAQAKQQTVQAQLDHCTERLATLAGQLAHLTTSGTQATLRQRRQNLVTEMQTTTEKWLVDRLASQWIETTLAAASGDRLPQIIAQASEFYGKLTENRYTKIELTSTTLQVQKQTGEWRTVSQLSRGTAEQLDLAVKLAFAVVMQQQVAMPLIIDDGFVNFDERRRQAAYALLAEISHKIQVILLTADTTVIQLATGRVSQLSD
ncbi:ATP-binding protein [Levilactobacillus brevis]|uniref:ATP-binding protein n=1 Tax=Levilactobacillus brevis TaxID=1580 RepID=UPI00339D2A51